MEILSGDSLKLRDQDVKTRSTAHADLAKRHTQVSKPIDQCPKMLTQAFKFERFDFPIFVASYCNEASNGEWTIICGAPWGSKEFASSHKMNKGGSGKCGKNEMCIEGPLRQNGLPRASCVLGSALVSLSTSILSKYHRTNESNSTGLDRSSSSRPTLPSSHENTALDYHISQVLSHEWVAPSVWLFRIYARDLSHDWVTCFLSQGTPRKNPKASHMMIRPSNVYRWQTCKNCNRISYQHPEMLASHYSLQVELKPGSEQPKIACVQGIL